MLFALVCLAAVSVSSAFNYEEIDTGFMGEAGKKMDTYEVPEVPESAKIELLETFQEEKIGEDGKELPHHSQWRSQNGNLRYTGEVDAVSPNEENPPNFLGDTTLELIDANVRYGYYWPLKSGNVSLGAPKEPLVFQYEVGSPKGMQGCGGMYLKALETKIDVEQLKPDTPFSFMFGPDRCGAQKKLHFIWRFENPMSLKFYEHQWAAGLTSAVTDLMPDDDLLHHYQLVIYPETWDFTVAIDGKSVGKFNIFKTGDFNPDIIPEKMVANTTDFKPEDWPKKKIVDTDAKKPDSWDESAPKQLNDPNAKKPADWDDEDDGEWAPPLIPNPDYKGKWKPPLKDNPDFKGHWKRQLIPNEHYFELKDWPDHQYQPMMNISAVGLEVWTVDDGTRFDNIYVGRDVDAANKFYEQTSKIKMAHWMMIKNKIDAGRSIYDRVLELRVKLPQVPKYITDDMFVAIVLGSSALLIFVIGMAILSSFGGESAVDDKTAKYKKDDGDDGVTESKEDEEQETSTLKKRKKKSPKA